MTDLPPYVPPYVPPKVWTWAKPSGGQFANINRPIAGPTHDKELPVGRHPLQLYSLATPNGVKVTIMLEELLALVGACMFMNCDQTSGSWPCLRTGSSTDRRAWPECR